MLKKKKETVEIRGEMMKYSLLGEKANLLLQRCIVLETKSA